VIIVRTLDGNPARVETVVEGAAARRAQNKSLPLDGPVR
jgi:hypothetical protein